MLFRACALIYSCAQRMVEHIGSGLTPLAALDEEKIAFTRITKAHCHAVVLKAFTEYVDGTKDNPDIYSVLLRLLKLYASYWMELDLAEFIAAKVILSEHHADLMAFIRKLLRVSLDRSLALPWIMLPTI